jgi:hypothetical protein
MHSYTSQLLMIRPAAFGFNAETAVNNAFQVQTAQDGVQEKALQEFDDFVDRLRAKGVQVTVVQDSPTPHTPDSIFPNNWISFHEDGTLVYYPMFAENRRKERKQAVIDTIKKSFQVNREIDYCGFEKENRFLEGTGSMVLDRAQGIAYACLSPRTEEALFKQYCQDLNLRPCSFYAVDQQGGEIYHTNVMMCVADQYVVICLDSIRDLQERTTVMKTIEQSGKKTVEISLDQMNHFAGNMLQVANTAGTPFLVMSSQAYAALRPEQIEQLESYNEIIHSPLTTIETNGGGSARCMMAEVFLHPQSAS